MQPLHIPCCRALATNINVLARSSLQAIGAPSCCAQLGRQDAWPPAAALGVCAYYGLGLLIPNKQNLETKTTTKTNENLHPRAGLCAHAGSAVYLSWTSPQLCYATLAVCAVLWVATLVYGGCLGFSGLKTESKFKTPCLRWVQLPPTTRVRVLADTGSRGWQGSALSLYFT
jgi:hypothetical protein